MGIYWVETTKIVIFMKFNNEDVIVDNGILMDVA
jgi:hypothetical protein